MDKKRRSTDRLRVRVKKHRIRQSLQNDSSETDSEIAVESSSKEPNLRVEDFGAINADHSSDNLTENIEDFNEEGDPMHEEDERRQNFAEREAESSAEIHQDTASDTESEPDSEAEMDLLDNEEVNVLVENDAEPEIKQLKEWAIENQIKQEALDKLLKILRVRLLTNLPKSSKTFLSTSATRYNIIQMEDGNGSMGEFVYFGLEVGLRDCINIDNHRNDVIELQINSDGLRLVDSGYQELWPLVGRVHFNPDIYKPFPIAVYFGETKPKSIEAYLSQFIEEINGLQANGINISGRHFAVRIKCFICDTPARALLKGTVGHTGFNACERCTVQGFKEENTTVFPSVDSVERTDESFRSGAHAGHHNIVTPLCRIIPFVNLISCFILDFMHLCCLGVMKRLLEGWLKKGRNKLSRLNRLELSRRMTFLKSQMPCEYKRKIRTTDKIGKWKATEYRFFLLYGGVIVLKSILNKRLYKHFILFHAACRILCSEKLCHKYTDEAKEYLRVFFVAMGEYYGLKSHVLNVHNLIHLADDVKNMGCSLSRITAFPFENFLGKLKKYIRTANRPLAQLCRRLHEMKVISSHKKVTIPPLIQIVKIKENRITAIMFKESTITNVFPNNTVLMNDGTILEVKNISSGANNKFTIRGEVLEKKKPLFLYPFNSKYLNMWQLKAIRTSIEKTYDLETMACKLVRLCINFREEGPKKEYVIPLLHQTM